MNSRDKLEQMFARAGGVGPYQGDLGLIKREPSSGEDYDLHGGSGCWICVNGITAWIRPLNDNGMLVELFTDGAEEDEPLATAQAVKP